MGTTFPKDIMDCMKGCILSIFWPKKDIVDFMKKSWLYIKGIDAGK